MFDDGEYWHDVRNPTGSIRLAVVLTANIGSNKRCSNIVLQYHQTASLF